MADARSLLRQQRAARQQALKPQQQSKKRKAADESVEERKRTRTEEEAGVPAGFFDAGATKDDDGNEAAAPATAPESVPIPDVQPLQPPKAANPPLDATAEAELDAFMAEMSRSKAAPRPSTLHASAVVESAPMTAAEVAAQARQDLSAQRAKNDDDMEGEKEDAARALADEFEEMEGLEERVKRLREQREALRLKPLQPVDAADVAPGALQAEAEGDSDSDDEDWDDWRFRPA